MAERSYLVTVCADCLRVSCWHYTFPCDNYRTANLKTLPAAELDKLNREHPDNYTRERILEVEGAVHES